MLIGTLEADGQSVADVEAILEELVHLQSSCPTFRELFESQQTTQTFIQALQSFVARLSSSNEISRYRIRISEKLMHFALTLALDSAVAGPQRREVCFLSLLPPKPDITLRSSMLCKVLKTFSTVVTQNKQKSTRHWFPVDAQSGIGLRQQGLAFNLVNVLSKNQWPEFMNGVLLSLRPSENAYEKTFWTGKGPPLRL